MVNDKSSGPLARRSLDLYPALLTSVLVCYSLPRLRLLDPAGSLGMRFDLGWTHLAGVSVSFAVLEDALSCWYSSPSSSSSSPELPRSCSALRVMKDALLASTKSGSLVLIRFF